MQKTDLNVSPYYDDFDFLNNFHRVSRPGKATSKELTQLHPYCKTKLKVWYAYVQRRCDGNPRSFLLTNTMR